MYFWIALIVSVALGALKIGMGFAIPWGLVALPVILWFASVVAFLAVAGWAIIKAIRYSIRTIREFVKRVQLPE